MKDKRNCHGTVGKSSSEQHFHKCAAITFIVQNFWNPTPSATRAYGRLADEIQVNFEILNLAVGRNIQLITSFNQGTASLQPYQCIPAGFSGKTYCKLIFQVQNFQEAVRFPTNPYY